MEWEEIAKRMVLAFGPQRVDFNFARDFPRTYQNLRNTACYVELEGGVLRSRQAIASIIVATGEV